MGQLAIPWLMLAAAFFAAVAAGMTWWHANNISRATTSSNLVNCLTAYTTIMRSKTKALDDKSEQQCKDFYRELFDLHWTEFQMWRDGLIPNHVMKAWLAVRHRNYLEDTFIQFEKDVRQVKVSYRQVWDELERTNYFEPEPTDQYRTFMRKVHELAEIDIKKLKKEVKKR